MGYYTLKNPREGINEASISVFFIEGKELASVSITHLGSCARSLGYYFKGLVAAKRYFATHYQSKKYGFETPIWEKQKIESE